MALCHQLAAALNKLGLKRQVTAAQVSNWIKLDRNMNWRPDTKLAREQIRNTPPEMGMRLPRSLRSVPRDEETDLCPITETTIEAVTKILRTNHPPGEMRHDWRKMAYTDGSLRKLDNGAVLTGAAVYLPDKHTGLKGRTIRVNPSPGGVQDTINRAELVALHEFLKHSQEEGAWNAVATDSLTSIRLIWKAVTNPANIKDHLHKELLLDIARLISERETPIDIYKIKSHVGMIGNEMADIGANQATMGTESQNHTGATRYRPDYWVSTKPTKVGDEVQEGKAVTDLRGGLKGLSHSKHKLGNADLEGIYTASWRDTIPIADTTISSLFVQRNIEGITENCRRQALLYRTGGLVTQKTLHRWNKASSPNCLLCGELDGGHHAISGCPALSIPATERHNQAGRIIAEAICSGRHSSNVVMMDIGCSAKLDNSGVPTEQCSRYLPTHYFPRHLTEEERRALSHKHRVDIALTIKDKKGKNVLHLVEIKTCRDTSRDDQIARAQEQHATLRELLEAAGVRHEIHTIAIGVSGTVYKDTTKTLKLLGVDKKETKEVLRNLHICMVKWVENMLNIRNMKIQSCSRTTQPVSGRARNSNQAPPTQEPSWKKARKNQGQKRAPNPQTAQQGMPPQKKGKLAPRPKRDWGEGGIIKSATRPTKRRRPDEGGTSNRKRLAAWAPQPGAGGPSKRAKGGDTTIK